MHFDSVMNDRVSLVKKDGTVIKEDIKALVSKGKIMISDALLPIEIGDHLLRKLPNGLVEDYIVEDPNFNAGVHGIKPFFNAHVRRSDLAPAQSSNIIHTITANISGPNSRLTIGTDNSVNTSSEISTLQVASFLEQLKPVMSTLPQDLRDKLVGPMADIEAEVKSAKPDKGKLRSALQTMKTVAEGAAGNLVASGIAAMIASFLPS